MNNGKLIILMGISGVGKTFLKEYLAEKYGLYILNRVITRDKRNNEDNNTDLHVTKEQFEEMINQNQFFIYTKIFDNYYGYLKSDLKKIEKGIFAIGDCYYKLLYSLKEVLKDRMIVICIQPRNIYDTIQKILEERTDYAQRITSIYDEYKFYVENMDKFDYVVYNDYTDNSKNEICKIISKIMKKGVNK